MTEGAILTEEIEILKEVASRLNAAGIEYMMTGSMAMAVYAMPRMTRDIDLILHVATADTARIIDIFKDDFYIDEATVREAVRDRTMFNIIHNDSVIKVDCIIRKNTSYRVEEFSRRQTIDLEQIPVSIVSPEDLVLSKLVWARHSDSELQLRDVQLMLKSVKNIDYIYLHKWAGKLDVADMLEKAAAHE